MVREQGQDVLAATLVVDGTLRIEVRRTGENTRAGVVVGLMKAAPIYDTRMEDYARKVGDRVVIPTLALGAAVTLASGGMITRGVSVITMDIGTGVRVSVPTAILSTLTYAARQGILIRSGRAIEQLAKVDTRRLRQDRHVDPGQRRRGRHLHNPPHRVERRRDPASWRPAQSRG